MSMLMASVTCLHFSMQDKDVLGQINAKCHLCTLYSTCRLLCKHRSTKSSSPKGQMSLRIKLSKLSHLSSVVSRPLSLQCSTSLSLQ